MAWLCLEGGMVALRVAVLLVVGQLGLVGCVQQLVQQLGGSCACAMTAPLRSLICRLCACVKQSGQNGHGSHTNGRSMVKK